MSDPSSSSGSLLASATPGDNAPAQSVSELSGALKRTVEDRFGNVRVRGEISGWKRAASGHCYFTLKDENACIDAVLWKGSAARLAFRPEDGAEVIAGGKLTTYPGRSKYQVVVETLELAGEGALMALLEKRKRAMAAEGLFASERKQALPYLPRVIGVVTSPTGAVIRDILHRLEDRCPTHVIVWPVQVQGERAAGQVAEAIAGFDALEPGGPVPRPDLLIVARGGGSIEDLWAFNEEAVVRAAAACSIPLISAVGHETDTTLIDHVSDRRAPTPTAAAEMAVPVLAEVKAYVADQGRRAADRVRQAVERHADRLGLLGERLPARARIMEAPERRFTEAGRGLALGLERRADRAATALGRVSAGLRAGDLDRRLGEASERLDRAGRAAMQGLTRREADEQRDLQALEQRLGGAGRRTAERAGDAFVPLARRLDPALVTRRVADLERRLNAAWSMAQLANPMTLLEKGYAMVSADGAPVTSAAAARGHARLELTFADGSLPVSAGYPSARAGAPVAKKRAAPYLPPHQRDLFAPDERNDGED